MNTLSILLCACMALLLASCSICPQGSWGGERQIEVSYDDHCWSSHVKLTWFDYGRAETYSILQTTNGKVTERGIDWDCGFLSGCYLKICRNVDNTIRIKSSDGRVSQPLFIPRRIITR